MQMHSTFPFFHGPRALRRYRDQLRQLVALEPAFRLLPDLRTLALDVAPLPHPEAILQGPSSLALVGVPTAGRTLALMQTLANSSDGDIPTMYLSLADDDATNLTPRAIIHGAIHRAGLPVSLLERKRPCVLLLDDFDALPANRRALWTTFLHGLPAQWPDARAVVALAERSQLLDLQPLVLNSPTAEQLTDWLKQLLPDHDRQPLLDALAGPLASLRTRLSDILLLALAYPISGLPGSRADLYAQAYALVRPLLDSAQPAMLPRIGRATLRHYRLARELAGGADFDLLAELPPDERAAVTPLAAGLLDDPRPVFDLLWRGSHDPGKRRALAACLRERPMPEPGLRLLGEILDGDEPIDSILLETLAPVLPDLLIAGPEDALRWLPQLAPILAQPAVMLRIMVDAPKADVSLRWAAADQLVHLGLMDAWPAATDEAALAMRCYVLALNPTHGRNRLLEPALREGTLALMRGVGGAERRRTVAQAILSDPDSSAELRALALATAPPDNPEDQSLLSRAVRDRDPELRGAALAALRGGDPAQVLAVISAALAEPETNRTAVHALIDAVATVELPAAQALLTRIVIDAERSCDTRLWALDRLALRGPASVKLLVQLLALPGLTAVVRAAAARHLGHSRIAAAIPALRNALTTNGPAVVRCAAAHALGELAAVPSNRDAILAGLLLALDSPCLDAEVTAAIAQALGRCGPAALPALGRLLGPEFSEELRAAWRTAAPDLEQTLVAEWPQLGFTPPIKEALLDILAGGETPADRPGGLDELVQRQAGIVAVAAADGMYMLLQRRPELRREGAGLLRRALQVRYPPEVLAHLIDRLGDLFGTGALAALLSDRQLPAQVRWLALDRLGVREHSAEWLLQRLTAATDDSFTQMRIIEVLGGLRFRGAVAILRQIAERDEAALQMRQAALRACSKIDDPTAFTTLWRIALDPQEPAALRATAIAGLPVDLDSSSVKMLRNLLQDDRVPVDLGLAVLEFIGRARDREALALLMRYAQNDIARVALAAIKAIGAIGDATVAPTLVRISQNAQAAPGVRLEAVSGLLQLCGEEYLPLLRSWLVSALLPLRLRAYAVLAEYCPDDPRLVEALADGAELLTLRIMALHHLQRLYPRDSLPALMLSNPEEDLQLRLEAVRFVATGQRDDAVESLVAALAAPAPPVLQRRCIDGLATLATGEGTAAEGARQALNSLLNGTDVHGRWAAGSLLV